LGSDFGACWAQASAASIVTVGKAFALPSVPAPADVFTAEFLPDVAIRRLP